MSRSYHKFHFVGGHRVMSQKDDVVRLRNDATGKECVLSVSFCGMQVYSLGLDSTSDGQWHAPADDTGVNYVANWVSPSSARKRFAKETKDSDF